MGVPKWGVPLKRGRLISNFVLSQLDVSQFQDAQGNKETSSLTKFWAPKQFFKIQTFQPFKLDT